jgi:IclR family transcriptional regulator, KDG regulon repressor
MSAGESRTVLRAISIVDCFSLERPELGVREVARRLKLASSTAGRLLATLQKAGVLTQNAPMRKYTLGPRVLAWAGIYTGILDVRAAAGPILDRLRQATRETTTLYVLDGDERVCVERLEGPQNIRAVVRLGERLPLYAGAGGKVLLAFLPPGTRQTTLARLVLTRFTDKTIRNRDRLERQLRTIRRQGYATSVAERFAGASAVAAPVRGADGAVIAAVNISGPSERFTGSRQAEYVRQVTKAALALSRAMGGGRAHL